MDATGFSVDAIGLNMDATGVSVDAPKGVNMDTMRFGSTASPSRLSPGTRKPLPSQLPLRAVDSYTSVTACVARIESTVTLPSRLAWLGLSRPLHFRHGLRGWD
eukprot:1181195-Prorocentrum_minimum.AAC.1